MLSQMQARGRNTGPARSSSFTIQGQFAFWREMGPSGWALVVKPGFPVRALGLQRHRHGRPQSRRFVAGPCFRSGAVTYCGMIKLWCARLRF